MAIYSLNNLNEEVEYEENSVIDDLREAAITVLEYCDVLEEEVLNETSARDKYINNKMKEFKYYLRKEEDAKNKLSTSGDTLTRGEKKNLKKEIKDSNRKMIDASTKAHKYTNRSAVDGVKGVKSYFEDDRDYHYSIENKRREEREANKQFNKDFGGPQNDDYTNRKVQTHSYTHTPSKGYWNDRNKDVIKNHLISKGVLNKDGTKKSVKESVAMIYDFLNELEED